MPTVIFHTLGCKANQYDTELLRQSFKDNGYEVISNGIADIYVINTCTVTNEADSDARKLINSIHKESPDSIIVITGCYAQVSPDIVSKIPGVNLILGNKEKKEIVRYLEEYIQNQNYNTTCLSSLVPRPSTIYVSNIFSSDEFPEAYTDSFSEHTRAFLKIQDGCNDFCSYCIVPYARGKSRSRKPENVILQAEKFIRSGYKEIVLTGIHLGAYGLDLSPRLKLEDIIYQLIKLDGLERLRLSSIEPTEVSDDLINLVAEQPKICRHFHIPLQSGDDEILKAMNRPYTSDYYYSLIEKIKNKIPDVGIGADVMVGFPGETDKNFENTQSFIEKLPITYMHIFSYSQREGTPSAKLPNQIPLNIKKKRNKIIRDIVRKKNLNFRKSFLNRTLPVLLERGSVRTVIGNSTDYQLPITNYRLPITDYQLPITDYRLPTTDYQLPTTNHLISGWSDNYIRVSIKTQDIKENLENQIRNVKIVAVNERGTYGMIIYTKLQ